MALNEKRRTKLSKFLSFVLRHEPQEIGIELEAEGWVDVDVLIDRCCAHGKQLDRDTLQEIVDTSRKKRFAFSEDGSRIRASQGHSVDIDLGYDPVQPPEVLYHGTPRRFLKSIKREGLQRMQRHHVHLSPEVTTATQVGRRRGEPAILRIRAGEMHREGYKFFVSSNNVWLTDHVPSNYIDFPDLDN